MSPLRVRLVQQQLNDGETAGNLARTLRAIEAARGAADLVVFPETGLCGFPTAHDVERLAEPLDGPSIAAVRDAARRAGIATVVGFAQCEAGRYFNSAAFIDEHGEIRLVYRKTHLYESDAGVFEPGKTFGLCAWRGLRVGIMICFDTEFPEAARRLAMAGADLIVVPDGLMHPHGHLHRTMLPVRAIENQCFAVLANRVGSGTRYTFAGASLAVDPLGTTLALAPADAEAVLDVTLDPARLDEARAPFRYLELARLLPAAR